MPGHQEIARSPVRLPGCDYALPGAFFDTICANKRSKIFDAKDITDFTLSNFGNAATIEWLRTGERRENVFRFEDEFIFMPNHLHGIIRIDHQSTAVGSWRRRAPSGDAFGSPRKGTLGMIVRSD
jgi:putative transposase